MSGIWLWVPANIYIWLKLWMWYYELDDGSKAQTWLMMIIAILKNHSGNNNNNNNNDDDNINQMLYYY